MTFVDQTKEIIYAYLYHRCGSETMASKLIAEVYLSMVSKALSYVWFGSLSLHAALNQADKTIAEQQELGIADLDRVYLPSLYFLSTEQRASVSTLHEALWTLRTADQRFLVLSMLVGLSDRRIATIFRVEQQECHAAIKKATTRLLSRWEPDEGMKKFLPSLVFIPELNLTKEAELRTTIFEKYSALRMRRYQWVIIGGLFAVLSNVVVASVLAFAVTTQAPTSLKSVRQEVASLSAVALQREAESDQLTPDVAKFYQQAQKVVAYAIANDVNDLALRKALEALQQQKISTASLLEQNSHSTNQAKTHLAWRPDSHAFIDPQLHSMTTSLYRTEQ